MAVPSSTEFATLVPIDKATLWLYGSGVSLNYRSSQQSHLLKLSTWR